jgi:hypothetical protein
MRDAAAARMASSTESMLPRKVRVMMELRNEIVKRYL